MAVVATALVGLMALAPGGCAARRPEAERSDAADVTGGLELELMRTADDRAFARYRVERDGGLAFGGGTDAVTGRYSWHGSLTADEIGRLTTLIGRNRWIEADPPSTGRPPGLSYTITLWTREGRRSFTVLGDEPGVAAVHALLETAARRRHDEFLEALPRAGERR